MIQITKAHAIPSAWTFTIKPIRNLINRYVGNGIGWVDPFAGKNSPAEFTNDWNPERDTCAHMDAKEWCDIIITEPPGFNGVLFDPPYSYRQITEHYKEFTDLKLKGAHKAHSIDTTTRFYSRVMNPICDKIRPGGYAISFGWNTNGFGKKRGFEQIEILIVSHGGHHNDTLVTVERKVSE